MLVSMVLTAGLNASKRVEVFSVSNSLDYEVSDPVRLTVTYKHGLKYISKAKQSSSSIFIDKL